MTTLRDYQKQGHDMLNEAIISGFKRICWVFPTGAGKSTICADYVRKCLSGKKSVLFLVHKKELVEQFADRLRVQFDIPSGIIMAGVKPNPKRKVQVASVMSLIRREKPKADIIFIDECHHAKANSYQKIIEHYPNAIVVGLTATPFRSDGKLLTDVFDTIVHPIKIRKLIKENYLVSAKTFVPIEEVNLDGLKTKGNDYDNDDAAIRFMDTGIKEAVAKAYLKDAKGMKSICFNQNVEHSIKMCAYFNSIGIRSSHIDGKTKKTEREKILKDFREGNIMVLHNYGIVTEGFDVPDCECVILNRATKSKGLWVQMVGRGLRTKEGKKHCILIDAGKNHDRFGFVEDYDLDNFTEECKKVKGVKCEKCNCIMRVKDVRIINELCEHTGIYKEKKEITYLCENCGNEKTKQVDTGKKKKKVNVAGVTEFVLLERDAVMLERIKKMTYNRVKKGTAPKSWLRIYNLIKGYKKGWYFHAAIEHGYVDVKKEDNLAWKAVNFELKCAEMEADLYRIYQKLKNELFEK